MSGSDPDAVLLARISQGDEGATRTLVAAKLPRVLGLATRLLRNRGDAEDVAQEVFLRVWRHAARWRPGAARFDTWLHAVTLNLCRDRMRRRREVTMPSPPEVPDPNPSIEKRLDEVAQEQEIAAAIAALPERQREAILLVHYQDLSNIAAAEALSISVEALESLLARGRRTLRRQLCLEENKDA